MGAPLGYGPEFSGNIFEKTNKHVLAVNRHHATILAGRLRWLAAGYPAGQVLARNSVDGLLDAYASGGASGTNVAVGILYADLTDAPSGYNALRPVIYRGEVDESKLVGFASGVVNDLKGREIVTLLGNTILSF